MSLTPVFNRLSQHARTDFSRLVVFALLIPGCAGNRIDLLTSQVDKESSEAADADEEPAGATDPSDSGTQARNPIAEGAGPLHRLTAFARRGDDDKSQNQDQDQDKFARRFRAIWNRDASSEKVATSDPFIGSDEAADSESPSSDQLVTPGDASVDDLLAKFSRNVPKRNASTDTPWWDAKSSPQARSLAANQAQQTRFVDDFDSRLDRLRAELASAPAEQTRDAGSVNPFADRESTSIAASEPIVNPNVDSVSSAREAANPPQTDLFPLPRIESRSTPKDRIREMLADARTDLENWNLRRAYRTALDAQALAIFENIEFSADEQHPQELAEQIAAELRRESLPQSLASGNSQDSQELASRPFQDQDSALSPLDFPEFGPSAGHWESLSDRSKIAPAEQQPAVTAETSRRSGVHLFPPDDDFPSAAESPEWYNDPNSVTENSPQPGGETPDEIQLAMHAGSDGKLSSRLKPSDQLPGLTERDNQQLRTSVSEQRSRVFESKKLEWPSLPTLSAHESATTDDREPIRIAQAPRRTLETGSTSAPATAAKGPAVPSGTSSSVLGQIWRSQPIWFVGGLVLLVIALRLLPWPKDDSNS